LIRRAVSKGRHEYHVATRQTRIYFLTQREGRIRCAIYARYSSDNQRQSSIEDQIRNCREAAAKKGWVVVEEYIFSDSEKTGTTMHGRSGLQSLMAVAKTKPRPFEYIIVDDTSRFGRNKADSFKNLEILTFYEVHLYFVEDGLDSAEAWFDSAFYYKTKNDSQFSISLGHKIRRGRRGRFIDGYNPGGTCYGYINVPDEDPTRKGDYGRPAVKGVYQVILPEQAAIVVRIFEMYASGISLGGIAGTLNEEGIPTSQGPRTQRRAAWCKTAINEMLKNPRYIGKTTWGCTRQVRNPETGKLEKRYLPEAQWERKERPELRIISDELWTRVQEQSTKATRGFGVKRLGGMSRTEASRRYLFSGLLKCAVCGGNMTITTTKPPRYGCSRHRNERTCGNKATILVEALERQFVSAITEKLQSNTFREELVQALVHYLQDERNKSLSRQDGTARAAGELEAARATLTIQVENLVRAVRECGGSRALLAELGEAEAALERVDERLAAATKPPPPDVTEDEVRAFIGKMCKSFTEILLGAPETLKHGLQRRITSITLTPSTDEAGIIYTATGDVGLFSSPEDALQTNQVHLIGLHHTFPISCEIRPYRNRQRWAEAVSVPGDPTWVSIPVGEPLACAEA
jgi:site-specific DNA recombinase